MPIWDRDLVDRLLTRGVVTHRQVAECEEACQEDGGPTSLVEALLRAGYVDAAELDLIDTMQDVPTTLQGGPPTPPAHETQGTRVPFRPTIPQDARRIAQFAVLEEIGRGGMGVVFRAWDTSLERLIALKVQGRSSTSSDASSLRFRREAQTAARLRHPGIVQVHEVGEADGNLFIAMDFIGGGTLRRWMEQKPRRGRECAEMIATIAEAVGYAHQQGVVHRDIKPENVLLDGDGRPYVGDFGLAREVDASTRLTLGGMILGTPTYMSPEQASGETEGIGSASDVYSLGVVLYEMLTGRPPLRGEGVLSLLQNVLYAEVPRPSTIAPDIAQDLEWICMKCLEKEAQRRYPTAADLAHDLRRFLAGESVEARPPSLSYRTMKFLRRRRVALLLGLGISAAAALVTWLVNEARVEREGKEAAGKLVAMRELIGAAEAKLLRLETWGRHGEERDAGKAGEEALREEVNSHLTRAEGILPGHPEVLVARARYELCRGREGAALDLANRAVQGGGSFPALHFVRGWALLEAVERECGGMPRLRFEVDLEGGAGRFLMAPPQAWTAPEEERVREAERELLAYLASGGVDLRAWRSRLALPFADRRFSETLSLYDEARKADAVVEFDPWCRWHVALAHLHLGIGGAKGGLEAALEHLAWLESRMEDSPVYWYRRFCAEYAARRFEGAIAACDRAMSLEPSWRMLVPQRALAWAGLAEAQAARGEDPQRALDEAIDGYEVAWNESPADTSAALGLAVAHRLRASLVPSESGDAMARAREVVDRACAACPEDLDLMAARALFQWSDGRAATERGEDPVPFYEAALEGIERVLGEAPAHRAALSGRPLILHAWGNRRAERGEDPKKEYYAAIDGFTALAGEGNAVAVFNRANVCKDLGNWLFQAEADPSRWYDAALAGYDEILRQDDRCVEAMLNRGSVLLFYGGWLRRQGQDPGEHHASALVSFDRALTARPNTWKAHSGRGKALTLLGRHAEAAEAFAKALDLHPGDALLERERQRSAWRASITRAAEQKEGGDHAGARAILTEALAVVSSQGTSDANLYGWTNLEIARCDAQLSIQGSTSAEERERLRTEALRHLGEALRAGSPEAQGYREDPELAPLRDHPEWGRMQEGRDR